METIDVSEARHHEYTRPRRGARYIFIATSLMLGAFSVWVLARVLFGGYAGSPARWGFISGAAVFSGLLGYVSIFTLAPGPVRLTVDRGVVVLVYANGAERHVDLTSRSTKLTFQVYPNYCCLIGGSPYRNPLTCDGYASIMRAVESLGLRVMRRPKNDPYSGPYELVTVS